MEKAKQMDIQERTSTIKQKEKLWLKTVIIASHTSQPDIANTKTKIFARPGDNKRIKPFVTEQDFSL